MLGLINRPLTACRRERLAGELAHKASGQGRKPTRRPPGQQGSCAALDGSPRQLTMGEARGDRVSIGIGSAVGQIWIELAHQNDLPSGRSEDGAPHRLYLKTKDPLGGGRSAVFGFPISTSNPPSSPRRI